MWQNKNFPEASMYCIQCGKPMDDSARFCTACGAAVQPAVYARMPYPGQLTRPRHPRMIAGVCAAFALHYGWDLSLVRVLTVLGVLFTGVGLFVYLAAWIIIPEAPYLLPEGTGSANMPGGSPGSPGATF
jgi:phage shock protein C